jgi:hypothetical protein
LLALGGIAVSYGVGAGAMTAVGGLCIHALYGSPTTVAGPLPTIYDSRSQQNASQWPPHNSPSLTDLLAAYGFAVRIA